MHISSNPAEYYAANNVVPTSAEAFVFTEKE